MNLVYGMTRDNDHEAQRIYQERYPHHLSHHITFPSIDRRLWDYGSLEINKRTAGHPRTVRTPDMEEVVKDTIEEKPFSSTRTTARDLSPLALTFFCISYRAVTHKGSVSGHMFICTF
jgi:hypothetical protein